MPSRIHSVSKTAAEPRATLARLAAQGDTITSVVDVGHEWVIVTERRPAYETRVEAPDTHGEAHREVRG